MITFNDDTVETGKAIFLDNLTGCNASHFNAGANDTIGATLLNPTTGAPPNAPLVPVPGANKSSHTDAELLRQDLAPIVSPVVIPQDPGDGVPGGATREGGFNVQSIIEAPRKQEFFHNGAFTAIEDAASFYFTPRFDSAQSSARIRNVLRGGKNGPATLAALAVKYPANPPLDTLGFFLRALNTVYGIADCERLVQDTIDRINLHLPTNVPVLNCTTNLNDVNRVIAGAHVTVPAQYLNVQGQVGSLASQLKHAANNRNKKKLAEILDTLKGMRQSIATVTPDLPE